MHGDTDDGVTTSVEKDWLDGLPKLRHSNPRADGPGLLDRFANGMDPTADNITTLIALLHRTISTADKDLIATVDSEAYGLRAVARSLHSLDDPLRFAKDVWGKTERVRATRLLNMTVAAGFHRVPRTKLPDDAHSVADETWLRLARMSRSDFLEEMESITEAENLAIITPTDD